MKCYVLAGGLSQRMGRDKCALKIGDATFLDRIRHAAENVFDEIVIVRRTGQSPLEPRTIFELPHDIIAPIFGLDRALEDTREQPAFVLAVDYPFITPELLAFLRTESERAKADIVVPQTDGKIHMLAGCYAPGVRTAVQERIGRREFQLRRLLDEHRSIVIPEKEIVSKFGREALLNVNEPADYEEVLKLDERVRTT